MNNESAYTLPSGLASCAWDIRTDEIEWRIPGDARRRNEALKEALKQLCLLQQERDQLAAHVEQLRIAALNAVQLMSGGKAKAELHCPTTVWNREERADEYANKIRSEATK